MRPRAAPGRIHAVQVHQTLDGRYFLLEPLGTGGMAVVWRAIDQVLGRQVAVKMLASQHADDPARSAGIREEARAAAALSHPHIAQIHDFGECYDSGSRTPYVVMEFVDGQTLLQRLDQGPIPVEQALRTGAEIASGLAAAHAKGLVHRDIKLANVMIDASGAKIVDFGIAAPVGLNPADQSAGELLGTAAYIAPERLMSDAVEPAVDIYAFGVLMFKLLAGRSPWHESSTTGLLHAHLHTEPDRLPAMEGVPDYVTQLCDRCLDKDPAGRPTARELSAVLQRAASTAAAVTAPAAERPAVAPGVRAATVDVTPAVNRSRRGLALLAAAVLAILVAASIFWWPVHDTGAGDGTSALAATTPSHSAQSGPAPVLGAARSQQGIVVPATTPSAASSAGAHPSLATTPSSGAPAQPNPGPQSTGPKVEPTKPATPAPPTTTAPPESGGNPGGGSESNSVSLSSGAGSLVATCPLPINAQILYWKATAPYTVLSSDPGPSVAPSVVFAHGDRQVKMTVNCTAGIATAIIS